MTPPSKTGTPVYKTPSASQRQALGAFLRSCRERLVMPPDATTDFRRRTPGRRREEVAHDALVSVSWYSWLEQGRDIKASTATLLRIADALQLNDAERLHLLTLSDRAPPVGIESETAPSEAFRLLFDSMGATPAYLPNSRLDVLLWNDAIAELFVDYGALPPSQRNTLWLLFLHPPYRTLILDWEDMAHGMLEVFRAAYVKTQNKAPFEVLITELSDKSPEFRHWWAEHRVRRFDEGRKRLNHPVLGRVDLTYLAFAPEGHPDLSLVFYLPRRGEAGITG